MYLNLNTRGTIWFIPYLLLLCHEFPTFFFFYDFAIYPFPQLKMFPGSFLSLNSYIKLKHKYCGWPLKSDHEWCIVFSLIIAEEWIYSLTYPLILLLSLTQPINIFFTPVEAIATFFRLMHQLPNQFSSSPFHPLTVFYLVAGIIFSKCQPRPCMVASTCNSNTWESKAGVLLFL